MVTSLCNYVVANVGSVGMFLLFFAVTRLMKRTGWSSRSWSQSAGRRICNIMKFLPRATTILRSLSCTLPGSLLVILIFTLWSLLLLFLQKCTLTWLHNNDMKLNLQQAASQPAPSR
ncbi:uncharacterized protein LOC111285202 [Durio zibethinus]|uniref:Uncharacterized protein LOC111285202 n=1 Tax=Durio zibethinus TaxID=66656 RepID=A0A6P5XPZ7_DURZI|nr:uncharacterized protein LOC111285202 [Durio zibethinus]XP_022730250.1 uncharacterized protein LOC111285202 [Durio zibethinus]